jgi:hypothetical protein
MTEAEALGELGRRYRIRIVVELEHQDRQLQMRGSTMVEHPDQIGTGLVGLVELMAPRLLRAALGETGDGDEGPEER